MPEKFVLAEHMEKLISLSDQLSVGEALAQVRRSNGIFAVVKENQHPQALLRDEYLSIISDEEVKLAQVLHRLPPLLTIDAEVESLSMNDLKGFSRLLYETKSPGIVVLKNDKAVGAISRGEIARALPLTTVARVTGKPRFGGGAGQFVQYCTYICRQCPPPPPRRRPRECDVAPICPREPDHGEMDLE